MQESWNPVRRRCVNCGSEVVGYRNEKDAEIMESILSQFTLAGEVCCFSMSSKQKTST